MSRKSKTDGIIMFIPPFATTTSLVVCVLKKFCIITNNIFWSDVFLFISFTDLFVIFIVSLVARELLIMIRR